MDAGPIIAQGAVPVASNDTPGSLGERVLAAEHKLYPLALRLVAEGRAALVEGRCVFTDVPESKGVLLVPGV
jgi:phosphoribosylglycinamide formyltransferase-1